MRLPAGPVAATKDVGEAAKQLEAMMLRQLIASSGAFRGSGAAGSQVQTDMFVEALSDAVAKSGGFGLAKMLEREMGGVEGGPEAPAPAGAGTRPGPHAGAGPRPLSSYRPPTLSPPPREAPAPPDAARPPQVTSGFGTRRDPLEGGTRFHTGVDLRGAEGSPIAAAAAGVVKSAGPRGGYGNTVEIDHGGGVTTLYAHASELDVKPGDFVTAGQEVARVGHTGRATGPHLHFEVRVDGHPVDPARALIAYGARAEKTSGGKATGPALK